MNLLDKLNLLIIENFYDLYPLFFKVKTIMTHQYSFIANVEHAVFHGISLDLTFSDFEKKIKLFETDIVSATFAFKEKFNQNYINKPRNEITFIYCIKSAYKMLRNFFRLK